MRELVRANDPVLISAIEALLNSAGIPHLLLDQNMSVLEGSIGILARRILVPEDRAREARRLMEDAGLGHELRADADVTEDAALNGRVRLRQPKKGHRFGHDAILLAAATDASAGQQIVELGAGVGAAGLALALRVPNTKVTLLDVDENLVDLAEDNARLNNVGERVRAVALDVSASAWAFSAAGLESGAIARVMMNPPFNDPSRHQRSPLVGRAQAHVADDDTLAVWTTTAARLLGFEGALTLIWRADELDDVLAALSAAAFGNVAVLPVFPRPGVPAIRILVRAVKGSLRGVALLPGLTLNDAAGKPTAEAEAVLRGGETLRLVDP